MSKSTILSGTDLSKKYGDLEVVKGVSLAIERRGICLPRGKIGLRQDNASFPSLRTGKTYRREGNS